VGKGGFDRWLACFFINITMTSSQLNDLKARVEALRRYL
jgi:hypothetical protein